MNASLQLTRTQISPSLSRYIVSLSLRQLLVGGRLNLDQDTYVIRTQEGYVAYRTWMSIFPLIEVFYPDQESQVVNWLEQFGYSFG